MEVEGVEVKEIKVERAKHYTYSLIKSFDFTEICNHHGFMTVTDDTLFTGRKYLLFTKLSDKAMLWLAVSPDTFEFAYKVLDSETKEEYDPFYDSVEGSNWDCKEELDNFYTLMDKLVNLGLLEAQEVV